jgi:DNA polymerase III subunit epsilon
MGNYSLVVLDFETTGLSPDGGDRVIEVGAVLVSGNRITDSFQSLMNPGIRVSGFIEQYTGITNEMLKSAPPSAEVMSQLATFMGQHHLVAHNASFDKRFLDAELQRVSLKRKQEFACSLLLSRRLNPNAPSHSLETLARYKKLPTGGVYHRAHADAEMTAHLWVSMVNDLKCDFNLRQVPFDLMQQLAKVSKNAARALLLRVAAEQEEDFSKVVVEEFIAVGVFGNKLRLLSLTPDGSYRFLDGSANLQNYLRIATPGTQAFQRSIEELEDLINSQSAKEKNFQDFFERNPDFILNDEHKKAHPHLVLRKENDGQELIPDFVLEPIAKTGLADILELKLASTQTYVLKHNRPRFSAAVYEACAQLREYSAFFDEEINRNAIYQKYNILSYKPKMYVLIGRRGNVSPIETRRIHSDIPGICLRTYDDVIERMKYRLSTLK